MYAEATVIYSDILFLINFSLDFLCLFIAGRIFNCSPKTYRLIISAFIGGLYSFVPYVKNFNTFVSLLLHIIAAVALCFIAFGNRGLKKNLLLFGTFFVTCALLGGLITAFYSMSSGYSDGIYAETDAISFALICMLSAGIALSYGMISKRRIHIRASEIRIYLGGERVTARLLVDSGNLVTEPFSSLPVIVLSSSVLPPPYDAPESEDFPLPIRAIPFNTSAGRSCFLGFRPDKIEILQLTKKPRRIDAFIGIDTGARRYSGYDGLMPSSLL